MKLLFYSVIKPSFFIFETCKRKINFALFGKTDVAP
nr:MAG TPA: hypothetical protein [Bacteriophage sp.]